MVTMSFEDGNLSTLRSIRHTSVDIFSCKNNQFSDLPEFPLTMSHLNCAGNLLTSISVVPHSMSYMDVSNNNITSVNQDEICDHLISSGIINGYLDISGNHPPLPATLIKIGTLQSAGWTVNY
jgi:hypothetical protein